MRRGIRVSREVWQTFTGPENKDIENDFFYICLVCEYCPPLC